MLSSASAEPGRSSVRLGGALWRWMCVFRVAGSRLNCREVGAPGTADAAPVLGEWFGLWRAVGPACRSKRRREVPHAVWP